jgi:hypothetical protein
VHSGARPGSLVAATAIAGAVVLLWPNVPHALAASGSFTYTDAAGVSKTSANPPDDSCIKLAGSGKVSNNTDTPVGFYSDTSCKNRVAAVDKGDSGAVPQYASIQFGEDNKPQPNREPQRQDNTDRGRPSRNGTLPSTGGLGGLLGG